MNAPSKVGSNATIEAVRIEAVRLTAINAALCAALRNCVRWLDKAESDGAFKGCVPLDGGRKAIEQAIATIAISREAQDLRRLRAHDMGLTSFPT